MRTGPPRGISTSMRLAEPHELHRRLVAGVLDQHERVVRQAGLRQALAQRRRDRDVRADGARGAPQERGVAGLEAQPERVAGDVGAVLVDDRDDAEGHADALHLEPVGTDPAIGDLADRVGQPGHLAQAGRHRLQPGVGEPEPVDHGGPLARRLGRGHVLRVGGQDLRVAVEQEVGRRQQGGVLGLGAGGGQHPAGRLRTLAEFGHGVDGHPGSLRAGLPQVAG